MVAQCEILMRKKRGRPYAVYLRIRDHHSKNHIAQAVATDSTKHHAVIVFYSNRTHAADPGLLLSVSTFPYVLVVFLPLIRYTRANDTPVDASHWCLPEVFFAIRQFFKLCRKQKFQKKCG